MRATVLAFLTVSVVLAGCFGGDGDEGPTGPTSAECLEQGLILNQSADPPMCEEPPFVIRDFEDPQHHCVVTEQRDRVHAPDLVGDPWELGQSWTYSMEQDGEDRGTTKLVYYDDQDFDREGNAQHYMVGTVTREEALHHAVFSGNPVVGRVHRILYSPHESGDHADMFHFPLCEGSTWTTMFYAEEFELTATEAEIDLPGGSTDAGFLIQGSAPSGSTLRLSYSPAAQWFTFIDLDRADGGTVDLQLEALGEGYTGPAYFLRGQQDAEVAVDVSAPALPGVTDETLVREDGDNGPYDTLGVAVNLSLVGQGSAFFELVDPNGTAQYTAELGGPDGPAQVTDLIEVPFASGEWRLIYTVAGIDPDAPGPARLVGDLMVVSVYDRSGEV